MTDSNARCPKEHLTATCPINGEPVCDVEDCDTDDHDIFFCADPDHRCVPKTTVETC